MSAGLHIIEVEKNDSAKQAIVPITVNVSERVVLFTNVQGMQPSYNNNFYVHDMLPIF